jgi:hypothetical protein
MQASSAAVKEYNVSSFDYPPKAMFGIKEALKTTDTLKINCGTKSSETGIRATSTLERFGYIKVENVQTLTTIENGKRIIKLIITVKKTKDFDTLLQQFENERKQKEEKKQQQKETTENPK